MDVASLPLRQVCGQLIVGGFSGTELPSVLADALAEGHLGGAILFRRNCDDLDQVVELCRAIAMAPPAWAPALIGVDQEGGRVTRLPAPFTTLPPMGELGALGDEGLTRRAAEQVGRELRALGFTIDFAPVLDVDSNPDNPVIGDRSFGRHPAAVGRHGRAFSAGLQAAGVAACGKHFPGHGDTSLDSHVALPTVARDVERLEAVELRPFRDAQRGGIAALMSAHVVYPALDAERPATLSRAVGTELLRERMGFQGVLFSDDLEMGAIAGRGGIEQAAPAAVAAGCDALLICSDPALQQRAHEALVRAARDDAHFEERCRQALGRVLELRRRFATGVARDQVPASGEEPPTAGRLGDVIGGPEAQALLTELSTARRQRGEDPRS